MCIYAQHKGRVADVYELKYSHWISRLPVGSPDNLHSFTLGECPAAMHDSRQRDELRHTILKALDVWVGGFAVGQEGGAGGPGRRHITCTCNTEVAVAVLITPSSSMPGVLSPVAQVYQVDASDTLLTSGNSASVQVWLSKFDDSLQANMYIICC